MIRSSKHRLMRSHGATLTEYIVVTCLLAILLLGGFTGYWAGVRKHVCVKWFATGYGEQEGEWSRNFLQAGQQSSWFDSSSQCKGDDGTGSLTDILF